MKTLAKSMKPSLSDRSVPIGVGSMMSIEPRIVSAPRRKPITQSVKVTRTESGTRSESELTAGRGETVGTHRTDGDRADPPGAPGTNPMPLAAVPGVQLVLHVGDDDVAHAVGLGLGEQGCLRAHVIAASRQGGAGGDGQGDRDRTATEDHAHNGGLHEERWAVGLTA